MDIRAANIYRNTVYKAKTAFVQFISDTTITDEASVTNTQYCKKKPKTLALLNRLVQQQPHLTC